MSNFYDLLDNDTKMEKTASHQASHNMLSAFSTSQLEKIAEELGAEADKEMMMAANIAAKEEQEAIEAMRSSEEDAIATMKQKEEQAMNVDPTAVGAVESQLQKQIIDSQKEEMKDAQKANTPEDEMLDAHEQVQKEAAIAYAFAEEKLASMGLTTLDYVYSQLPNEKLAYRTAEYAEKIASIAGVSNLQAADELIGAVADTLNNY